MTLLDDLIDFMADEKGNLNHVKPIYYFAAIIPMWCTINPSIDLQLIIALCITVNSFVRIMYPSSYNPATSSSNHFLCHPFLARTLATLAEVMMYWIWARWVNQPYWGEMLGNTVVIGEILCWSQIIFCSRTFAFCEDFTWVVHACQMLYFSDTLM